MRRFIVPAVCLLIFFSTVLAGEKEEALRNAARGGDLTTVQRLIGEGVDVNAATRYGATALAYASDKGHIDVVGYLIEQGADVNATDTFYQATPVTWAAFNDRVEIIALLFEKGATGADQVLAQAVRSENKGMVEAALKGSDLTPAGVSRSLIAAGNLEDGEEIVALLKAVDLEVPEVEEIEVDSAVLQTYTGQYKNDDIGLGLDVRIEDGKLIVQATGQGPLTMRALSQERFEAIEFPQVKISFAGRGGMIEHALIEQGGQTLVFPRILETADAAPETMDAEETKAEEEADGAEAAATVKRGAAQNWPSFRGPGASGVADGQGAPVEWNVESGKNVLWKTPIPGLANSSPIIWGDHVFVTSAISAAGDDTFRTGLYGDVDSVEDLSEHTFKVYSLERKTGKIVWEATAGTAVPGAKRHMKSTQANSTPVTDGKRVVALFGTIGLLVAYDMDGKEQWKTDLGVLDAGWFYDETYQWGHASSPVIYDDLVIVQADTYKGSYIAAYKLADGKQAWKAARDEVPSWGTPTVYRGKDRDELITNGTTIRGYDPKTGKELWTLAPNSEVTVATPVIANGLIYVTAGYPPVRPIYAIRPGGSGNLSLADEATSSEAIAWSHDRGGTYMPTPIAYGDHLYTCANDGRLTAYDARSGERVYRQRVGGGTYTASPIAADGKLYFTTEEGEIVVARAGAEYEELARNDMGEICMSTPAISDGVMVVRTQKHVYGLGEKTEPSL